MRPINGWTEKDIQMLVARTSRSEEAVSRFCRAVDKQLYLLLPEHIKRATLHFHLSPRDEVDAQTENIIYLQAYRRNTNKGSIG